MAKKLTILEQATKIVSIQNQIDRLEELLSTYSYKNLDGKQWSFNKVGASQHFDAKRMLQLLPEEDQQAINNYVVRKTRAAIRNGKVELTNMGVK